jgi:hypothetical protein
MNAKKIIHFSYTEKDKSSLSKFARMVANISLRFNIFVYEFIELYKFHLVLLAKKQNPTHTIVEISARIGLDRRYVTEILNSEEVKKTQSKIKQILTRVKKICINKQTTHIVKNGNENSFADICKNISSSSLTNKAIASELIRQGEIIDKGNSYEIVNIIDKPFNNSIIYIDELKNILNEVKVTCSQNKSNLINQTGKTDSFESICKMKQSGLFSIESVTQDLIEKKLISEVGNQYHINNYDYFYQNNEPVRDLDLFTDQLVLLSGSLLQKGNVYQKKINTSQIEPGRIKILSRQITEILTSTSVKIENMIYNYIDDVPVDTYPSFGVTLLAFNAAYNEGFA